MNPTKRTQTFVAVAIVATVLAWVSVSWNQPEPLEGFDLNGEAFYPDFNDPTEADALMVVAFNDETATARQFSVENKDGNWVIPSHHDYPAESTDRLAETASSVNQITRGALVTRRKTDHERFGVIDPLDAESTSLKGRGNRLRILKGGTDGTVLCDLIIGNAVEGQTNTYYVRREDEDDVFASRIEIDLSTDFTEWIEPDLLKLDRDNVNRLVLNRYSLDVERGRIVDPQISILTRESFSEDWTLDGIGDMEVVKDTDVDNLAREIDDLKIVGVRPKPEGLRADLSIDPKVEEDVERLSVLQASLQRRGFFLAQVAGSGRQLVSKEGELIAGTNEGALYHLHFGNLFTGNTKAIEIGLDSEDDASEESGETDKESAEGPDDDSTTEDSDGEESDGEESDSPSRYLFVRVEFDEDLLGPAPVEPTEPEVPEGFEEWEKAQQEEADKPADANEDPGQEPPAESSEEADSDSDSTECGAPVDVPGGPEPPALPEPADATKEAEGKEPAIPPAFAEYRLARTQYETDLETYRNDVSARETKVKEGQEKVAELNRRFSAWYYVISAESFEKLRISRDDIVEPKMETPEEGDEGPAAGNGNAPGSPLGTGIPGLPPN